jgi:hypothetical protein
MRFMMIVKHKENQGFPPKPLMDAIGQLSEEAAKDGSMVTSGGLRPTTDNAARVRVAQGKLVTTDGPFTETKEIIGGFAIFDLKSREEAVASANRFMDLHRVHWPGWEGECEVRQMMTAEDIKQGCGAASA